MNSGASRPKPGVPAVPPKTDSELEDNLGNSDSDSALEDNLGKSDLETESEFSNNLGNSDLETESEFSDSNNSATEQQRNFQLSLQRDADARGA